MGILTMGEVGQADLGTSGSFSHGHPYTAPRIRSEEQGDQVPVWGWEMLLSPRGWPGGPCEGLSGLRVQPDSQQEELGQPAHMATGHPGT